MTGAWKTLREAGVPIGAARPRPRPGALEPSRLHHALDDVRATLDALTDSEREALYAWLRAFQHHWPERYRRLLGRRGSDLESALERALAEADPNRYLKLRRIAVDNLAAIA